MARYWIDESLIVNGEILDQGFILDTDTKKIEWTEPITNGATRTFDINECVYNDGDNTPVSLEDGEGIGITEAEYFAQFKNDPEPIRLGTVVYETDSDEVQFRSDGSVVWRWDTGDAQGEEIIPANTDFADYFESHGREDIAECFRTSTSYRYGKREQF